MPPGCGITDNAASVREREHIRKFEGHRSWQSESRELALRQGGSREKEIDLITERRLRYSTHARHLHCWLAAFEAGSKGIQLEATSPQLQYYQVSTSHISRGLKFPRRGYFGEIPIAFSPLWLSVGIELQETIREAEKVSGTSKSASRVNLCLREQSESVADSIPRQKSAVNNFREYQWRKICAVRSCRFRHLKQFVRCAALNDEKDVWNEAIWIVDNEGLPSRRANRVLVIVEPDCNLLIHSAWAGNALDSLKTIAIA
ncbi:hypothetical protein R3P38DRAFT_2814384 [Favolaschia claudopus]|uniref:Uncharacterized protein n=1 Tax=Favolaschia claudopus TaxID=2862362 RepID=A0AAV9Z331_9AGAR